MWQEDTHTNNETVWCSTSLKTSTHLCNLMRFATWLQPGARIALTAGQLSLPCLLASSSMAHNIMTPARDPKQSYFCKKRFEKSWKIINNEQSWWRNHWKRNHREGIIVRKASGRHLELQEAMRCQEIQNQKNQYPLSWNAQVAVKGCFYNDFFWGSDHQAQ